jgi:hypothetical protein
MPLLTLVRFFLQQMNERTNHSLKLLRVNTNVILALKNCTVTAQFIDVLFSGIMAAFSTVAFRYGHSEVNMIIPRLDENRRPIPQGHILFRDGYFNPPM